MPTCFITHSDGMTRSRRLWRKKKQNPGCIHKNCGPCRPPQAAMHATAALMCCQRHSDPERVSWPRLWKWTRDFSFTSLNFKQTAVCFQFLFFSLQSQGKEVTDYYFCLLGAAKTSSDPIPVWMASFFRMRFVSLLRYLVNMFIKYTVHTSCIEWAISQTSSQIL